MNKYIYPEWSVPGQVKSASSTRLDGVSKAPFDSFNLGKHVADCPDDVQTNRDRLAVDLQLPSPIQWLNQVHEAEVLYFPAAGNSVPTADAAWTDRPGCVLSVMTADCLPVLIADRSGSCVAAVHGGWRGLHADIIQKTIASLPVGASELSAWLGPAIGPLAFEVGAEVKSAFTDVSKSFESCFNAGPAPDKYLADIFAIGTKYLNNAGVHQVTGGYRCTYQDQQHFFSHRRDAGRTGRMATLIWIQPN